MLDDVLCVGPWLTMCHFFQNYDSYFVQRGPTAVHGLNVVYYPPQSHYPTQESRVMTHMPPDHASYPLQNLHVQYSQEGVNGDKYSDLDESGDATL